MARWADVHTILQTSEVRACEARRLSNIGPSATMPVTARTMPVTPPHEERAQLMRPNEPSAYSPMTIEEPPRPSFRYLLAITGYNFASGLTFGSMGLIVLPAEVQRLWPETQGASLGMLLALTGVTQLVAPVAGYLSDRSTHRLGRRRPYLLAGAGVAVIGLGLMRLARELALGWAYAAALFVAMLGLNTSYAGFTGLLPDLLPEASMGLASGLMAVTCSIGAALSFILFAFAELEVVHSYAVYAFGIVVPGLLTSLVAKETPLKSAPPVDLNELAASFVIGRRSHGDFFWVFWIRCTYYMAVSELSFLMLFIRDVVLPSDQLVFGGAAVAPDARPLYYTAMTALMGQFAAILFAVPLGRMSDTYGRKPLIYASYLLMSGVFAAFMCAPSLPTTLAIGFVFGMGNGGFLTVDYALAVDTLPDKRSAAKDLGLWGIAAFIGSSAGPIVLGPMLHFVGLLKVSSEAVHSALAASPVGIDAAAVEPEGMPEGALHKAELRYGLLGYQAIMLFAISFLAVSSWLLTLIRTVR